MVTRIWFSIFAVILVGLILGASSVVGVADSNQTQDKISDSLIDKVLTFIHSAAEVVGKGLVRLINMVSGIDVSELEQPLGYLGILTASLIIFGAIKAAQKVVWIIVLLGWGLIVIRIVLEALDKTPSA